MKPFLNRFAVLAVALLLLQWIAVGLFFGKVLFPPTLVTGICANLVYGLGIVAAVLVVAFHLMAFVLANVYLFVRSARPRVLSPLRAGFPSLLIVILLAALSLRYWLGPIAHHPADGPLGGIQAGLQLQGPAYVWCYGALNIAGFVVAVIALCLMMKKRAGPGSWLVFNWALYVSLFYLLFPWLGGLP